MENEVTDPGMAEDWAAANADVDGAEGGDDEASAEVEEVVEASEEGGEDSVDESDADLDPELAEALAEGEGDENETKEGGDPAADLETLKKLAEKLGLIVNDKGVTKRDIAAFTDKKRRVLNKLNQDRQEFNRQVEAAKAHFGEREKPLSAFQQALENQDLDGLAKIAGFENWNALQAVQLKRLEDPSYHEIQKLKAEREAERVAKEKAEAEHRARLEAENRSRGIQNYKLNLSKAAAASKDPLAKTMHDDRMFIETIYSVQKDLVDPLTGKTVSIEEALDVELPNGKTLRQNLKAHYEKLASVYGGKTSAPAVKDNPGGTKLAKTQKKEPAVTKSAAKVVTRKPAKKSEQEELNDELALFAKKMQSESRKSK